jgi:hypothetical protein
MSSNLIVYLIGALTMIVCVMGAFGLPAIAIVLVRYFKLKERELVLEIEYRQKSTEQQSAIDERVRRLEEVLGSLDRDVRDRLGIDGSTPGGSSRPELFESPASVEAPRGQLDPSRAKTR